jgi:hypothetical protein
MNVLEKLECLSTAGRSNACGFGQEHLKGTSLRYAPALFRNIIRLAWKGRTGTTALTYYGLLRQQKIL